MKQLAKYILGLAILLTLLSFSAHKFYVGIYQIDYVPQKKMIQITSRIFLDDINSAMAEKYSRKMLVGEPNQTDQDEIVLRKYLKDNLVIKVNGKVVPIEFMSMEVENDVLVCYLRSVNISKVTKFEIINNILIDYVTEQQNIIQTDINGTKKSLLLTFSKKSGQLTY